MELVQMPELSRDGIYLGAMTEEAIESLFPIARCKTKRDKSNTLEYNSKGFKSHMKGADKVSARYVVLIGEDELKNGTVWVKDLESKEEKTVLMSDF